MTLPSSSPSYAVNNNSSSNNSGGSNCGSSDTATTSTNIHRPSNNNSSIKNSQRCSRVVVPTKDRAQFDRLLSINSIVPFIHLPTPASSSASSSSLMNAALFTSSVANLIGVIGKEKEGGIQMKRNAATRSYHENDNYNNDDVKAPSPPKKSKVAPLSTTTPFTKSNFRSTTRERSPSDCVVTALLALGADRQ